MYQRNRLLAFAVIPFLALGLCAQTADNAAPADTGAAVAGQPVKTVAHWSRWDYPPETTPAEGQAVHIVEKGDTLWDLGAKYLGNPFAWPQIWELNKWVKDPHWIYPGDPIVVEASRGTVTQPGDGSQNLAPQGVANLAPDVRRVRKPTLDEYGFTFQDWIQMPFLVPMGAEAYFKQIGALKIVGQEDRSKNLLADGDTVYLAGGSDRGVKVGDRLVVTGVAVRKFHHPDDTRAQKILGDILEQYGIVRITHVYQKDSVAIIEKSLDGITSAAYAAPYSEPPAIVNRLRTDITNPIPLRQPISKVMFIRMNKAVAAGGDMVIIDHGTRDGFQVGDVLLTAHPIPLVSAEGASSEMTNAYLGQLLVIKAMETSATCRILRSISEVQVGDILSH